MTECGESSGRGGNQASPAQPILPSRPQLNSHNLVFKLGMSREKTPFIITYDFVISHRCHKVSVYSLKTCLLPSPAGHQGGLRCPHRPGNSSEHQRGAPAGPQPPAPHNPGVGIRRAPWRPEPKSGKQRLRNLIQRFHSSGDPYKRQKLRATQQNTEFGITGIIKSD